MRKHSLAKRPSEPQSVAGTASAASGGVAAPPASRIACSRSLYIRTSSRPGRPVMTPGNAACGIRTPGTALDVAASGVSSHMTVNGRPRNRSPISPPGVMTVRPLPYGSILIRVTANTSPRFAPSICTGPVRGWMTCPITAGDRGGVCSGGSMLLSAASRVSNTITCPGLARATVGISGCKRLIQFGSSRQYAPERSRSTTASRPSAATASAIIEPLNCATSAIPIIADRKTSLLRESTG